MLATIPFDTIVELILSQSSNELQTFGILKLIRIARLNKIVTYMNVKEDVKIYLKLAKMFFFLSIYFHILGCLWFYMVNVQKKWIPPLDTIYPTTTFYQQDLWYQYWMSVYHAVLIETANDIAPRIETIQVIFWTLMILIGAVVNAYIFGMIIFLVAAMNTKSNEFVSKLDTCNNAMKNLKLPKEMHSDVVGYLIYTEGLLDSQNELDKFLSLISKSLKEKITKHIFALTLSESEIFKGRKLLIDSISKSLVIKLSQPEDTIISQGDNADNLYFIAKGGWNVYVRDRANFRNKANVLKEGDYFGEVGIINEWKRTATVKSNNYSTLAYLNKELFGPIFEKHPLALKMIKDKRQTYNDGWKIFLLWNIRSVEYFKNAPDYLLEELYCDLKEESYENGAIICKSGDPIDRIYFVTDGEIEIFVNTYKIEISIESLYQGWSIGEYGVLGDYNYMFTAKVKSNFAKVYYITKSSIRSILYANKYLNLDIERWKIPPSESNELFLDFRMCRTESKRSRTIKILKLSCLRYLRIVKVFGLDFTFKTFNPNKEAPLKKKTTVFANTNKHMKAVIESLNKIATENREIKQVVEKSMIKIDDVEERLVKLEEAIKLFKA